MYLVSVFLKKFPLLICQGDDPYFNKLIRILATRCMTQVTSPEYLSEFRIISLRDVSNIYSFALHYKFRQFISVVGISVLQNIITMGLQHLFILISLPPLGDMQVSVRFIMWC